MTKKLATFFIDIDGTIIRWDGQPIRSAVKTINTWYDAGHHIVITTYRGDRISDDTHNGHFGKKNTIKELETIGLKYHVILFDCPSPRIVINDTGAAAIEHPVDTEWDYNIVQNASSEKLQNLLDSD